MIDVDTITNNIISEFPGTWNYNDRGMHNRQWLDALVNGFYSMWTVGLTVADTGPTGGGSSPHTHSALIPASPSISGLVALTMATPPNSLFVGAGGKTKIFVDAICDSCSLYLMSNVEFDVKDGENLLHIHSVVDAGDSKEMSQQIQDSLSTTGIFNFNKGSSKIWLDSFCEGIIISLNDSGTTDVPIVAGVVHTHILT